MSAFQVSDRHISALVAARTHKGAQPHGPTLPDMSDADLGRMLLRENLRSLAECYGDPIDPKVLATYTFDPSAGRLPTAALIKAAHCYMYQACEHRRWERSKAKKYCEALILALSHGVQGYEDAAWGL